MVGAAVAGVVMGLAIATAAQRYFLGRVDTNKASVENALLREKVEKLQQMVIKYQPLAYKDMKLRFTKGVNKAVVLGLIDQLLANKAVNIWWLPDSIERVLYFNIISLLLSVLDEMVEGMSINVAGHNVKLQLTYLDLPEDEDIKKRDRALMALTGMGGPSPWPPQQRAGATP